MKWIPFEEAVPEPGTKIFLTQQNPKKLIVKGKVTDKGTIVLDKKIYSSLIFPEKSYVVPIFYLRVLNYRWSIGNVE